MPRPPKKVVKTKRTRLKNPERIRRILSRYMHGASMQEACKNECSVQAFKKWRMEDEAVQLKFEKADRIRTKKFNQQTAPTNEDLETQIRYAIDDLLLSAELDSKISLRDLTSALKVLSPECQSASVNITENNYTQNNTQNIQNVTEHHQIVSLSPEDMNCEERFERIRRETREAIENNTTRETELDKLERSEG